MRFKPETDRFIEIFPWESEEQKEGFLHMLGWSQKLPVETAMARYEAAVVAAFLIQKNHEAHEWWVATIGTQLSLLRSDLFHAREELISHFKAIENRLDDEIKTLKASVAHLESELAKARF